MQIETATLLIIEMVVIIIISFSLGYTIGERRGFRQGIEVLNKLKEEVEKMK